MSNAAILLAMLYVCGISGASIAVGYVMGYNAGINFAIDELKKRFL